MGSKKRLDSTLDVSDTKKCLTQDEVHKFEVAHLERQLRDAKINANKLQTQLAELQAEKYKLEASNLSLQRQLLLQDAKTKTDAHAAWTKALAASYEVESIDGYNPTTGEILTNPK